MRNLKIVGRSLLRFAGEDPLPLTATAWDTASNSIICAFGPSESRAVIELKRLHQVSKGDNRLEDIASWDAPCPLPTLACDSILDLHHFSGSAITCLVLAGGDIILVRESPEPGQDLVEIVGSVDAGISAAAWSPDEELLTITTQADTLLLMTREIENLSSITLAPEDVNVSKHVSVGWGKKETQFRGKRARALQDPTVPEYVDEGVLSSFDDRSVAISWRGDGAYFAVNKVEQEARRMIRVYSREGQLDSVSEAVDGMEGALSWRPSGNLITSIQRQKDKAQVIFFERNGLRHGQFDLRFTSEELEKLKTPLSVKWNSDSSVLAVSYPNKVQLWTMGNYHYYLKQELIFPEERDPAVLCDWHAEKSLSLALATSGSLQLLEYLSTTTTGSTSSPYDYGLVAVIDGLSLKLTPLGIANVPPPMSLLQLNLEAKAVDAAISMSGTQLAVLSDHDVSLYKLDLTKRPVTKPELLWRSDAVRAHCPRHVTFLADDQVFVMTDDWDEGDSTIWTNEGDQLVPRGQVAGISSILSSFDYQNIYLHALDGTLDHVSAHDLSNGLAVPSTVVNKFPSLAPEVRVIVHNDQTIAFGLSKSGVLYANTRVLVRNCTSFVLTQAHLIFTTTQHHLKFVHLTGVEELEIPPDEPQKDERCRSIERGARLVTVMPTTYSVVLQMPRGNLETIYPRALVLAAIRRMIEAGKYGDAFFTCRSQRVDMNILHDHMPDAFMANVARIVDQLKKVEHIDLLISQIRDEDVSETMYKETLKRADIVDKEQSRTDVATGKTNRICDAFLAVLSQPGSREPHLKNIITAHVSKLPPDLESALTMIGKLRAENSPLTQKAAEHICFLADVNELYNTALGLYDLWLTLLMAQQSQKDPGEYVPELQELDSLPELRRRFKIDDKLKRRAKALTHLHALEAWDEVENYTVKHSLYAEALEMYKYDTPHLNGIMRVYASYLSTNNKHKDAGIAYEYLQDYTSAYSSYRSANLWRECLSSATLAGMEDQEIEAIATELAEGLQESKDFISASTIYYSYLNDLSTAARLLCKGNNPSEALRIVVQHRRPELITEAVDPALVESSASMTEFLAECKSQLNAQVPRLLELRQKKADDPLAFYEGVAEADIPDNISLAPTDTTGGNTFMTRYTGRNSTVNTATTRKTSKNKRREERKRARGKKGTIYEEEYLVNSIERLITRINTMGEEVQRLVEGLVRRQMRERASAVENAMDDVVARCREAVKQMYPESAVAGALAQGVHGAGGEPNGVNVVGVEGEVWRPQGGDATLWDSLQEMGRKKEAPVVKAFERLSLI